MVKPATPLMISTAEVTTGTLRQPNKKPDQLGFPLKVFSLRFSAPSAVKNLYGERVTNEWGHARC